MKRHTEVYDLLIRASPSGQAAHCVRQKYTRTETRDVVVKVGVFNLQDWGDDTTVTRTVANASIHQSYNPNTLSNDILVITLEKRVTFNNNIRPACLWDGDIDLTGIVGMSGMLLINQRRTNRGVEGAARPGPPVLGGPQMPPPFTDQILNMTLKMCFKIKTLQPSRFYTRNKHDLIRSDIQQQLEKYVLDIALCRAQGYDNAASISGVHGGAQRKIREVNPKALFSSCSNHSLNLCGVHAFACVPSSVTCFEIVEKLYSFFSSSTQKWQLLKKKTGKNLKRLSDTRWSAHYKSVKVVKENIQTISPKMTLDTGIIKLNTLNEYLVTERTTIVDNAVTFGIKKCNDMDINVEKRGRRKVVGWGDSELGPAGHGEPRMVRMPIVSTAACRASRPDFHKLTSSTTLCAGTVLQAIETAPGLCLGDSGGGLYILEDKRWRLRGVVSLSLRAENGENTCNLNEYIVFTDTAQYLPWIRSEISGDPFHIFTLLPSLHFSSNTPLLPLSDILFNSKGNALVTLVKVESRLRELGFGYRAKFIQKSASQIIEFGAKKWFDSLMNMEYKEARQELMKLHGIGPKVADCICLMSLKHLESVPIDTHVYQIAAKNYLPHLKGKKNVSEKMYKEIGDHFRELYGPLAGWAHTLFYYLPSYRIHRVHAVTPGAGGQRRLVNPFYSCRDRAVRPHDLKW
ncbi:hypothetical protein EVAR_76879_1 [Eumeta japonica]|uniref:N-glycosylase/DNA lyase n=1 Tax=Eumeta variegata TaxID=151549 RepID=A0A4C1SEW6_EUMVA|nr:hypothetical protein EVAR_76879_1 [Eumeta japonica]